jgi:dTDP-glucose 4,6-dehydratase
MKIVVTGGCGFIGSNYIIDQITNKQNSILNIDKITYAGNTGNLSSFSNNECYKFIKADICDYKLIKKIILEYKPDQIVHFAAESHVDKSIDSPLTFVNTNILGTANLLKATLEYWEQSPKLIKNNFRFLHVSTDEVFGSLGKEGLFTEMTSYDPSSPYSASKASSDHLVRAWQRTYGLPAIITNCSNNYGPFQFPEKLIPLIITNCFDKKPLPVYGTGDNIRDWLFVKDHCDAINIVINQGLIGETYNIGGNNEIENIEIVKTICNLMDKLKPRKNNISYLELITYVEDRPGHDFRYAINANKIKKYLNWEPKETFDVGIKKTINWYLQNEQWWRKIINNNDRRHGLKQSKKQ